MNVAVAVIAADVVLGLFILFVDVVDAVVVVVGCAVTFDNLHDFVLVAIIIFCLAALSRCFNSVDPSDLCVFPIYVS